VAQGPGDGPTLENWLEKTGKVKHQRVRLGSKISGKIEIVFTSRLDHLSHFFQHLKLCLNFVYRKLYNLIEKVYVLSSLL